MEGCLTVLKNNFAGTQAAEMSEGPPLTYFSRSRGTCDVTSAVRRSVRGRPFGGPFVARPRKLHVNNLTPLVAARPTPRELNAETWKQSARAARSHARSASTQPRLGAST